MPLDEKLAIGCKAAELRKAGDKEGASRLIRTIPEKTDKDSISSLTLAIGSFDDAFLALKAVEGLHYEVAEQVIPHSGKCRIKGFPMDAFHIAIKGHRTRLKNVLRSPGIDPIEKALLKQRLANLSAGQGGYVEKQKKALTNEKL